MRFTTLIAVACTVGACTGSDLDDLKGGASGGGTSGKGGSDAAALVDGTWTTGGAGSGGVTYDAAAGSGGSGGASGTDGASGTGGSGGTPPAPVSFSSDIVPIFAKRGCPTCHSSKIGQDLGNLALDGSNDAIYQELTIEKSTTYNVLRVNLANPPSSLLLTEPSLESPPDNHPTVVFSSPQDPDYAKILAWIVQGAPAN